jgi:hypothetical protein
MLAASKSFDASLSLALAFPITSTVVAEQRHSLLKSAIRLILKPDETGVSLERPPNRLPANGQAPDE